ncbi:hypothetical protein TIFTF001_034055 [Ficus carica]|uniref:Receptor-like serine/threonine-protein kinase n=1 Tax=Ficus carica TaxID=3494 RepID=A0AA88E6L4_FICCA|nr:hypothetical protein TIFTF001_034055 [Ficus carica]
MVTMIISCLLFLAITYSPLLSASKTNHLTLIAGSSLSATKPDLDVLTSPNNIFSAGFHPVGENTYCFAIWFTEPPHIRSRSRTIVWMANREKPVNGRSSKLTLLKTGNLVLSDASQISTTVWETTTFSHSLSQLHLEETGNMVLRNSDGDVLWRSFDSPTDTLLPEQPLTRFGKLVSSRSQTNFSSGFYKFVFDSSNALRLIYDSFQFSSVYWPSPWLQSTGTAPSSKGPIAMLDSLGNFNSSNGFLISSSDYGVKIQRMLRIDSDGNLRLYSRKNRGEKWAVTWQAFTDPCQIHGLCGANSLCRYSPDSGRECSCLPGHKIRNPTDWSNGCEPQFTLSCSKKEEYSFVKISNTDFYGYDYGLFPNYTLQACMDLCLDLCDCMGFQYSYRQWGDPRIFECYPKTILRNGIQEPKFFGDMFLKVPKIHLLSFVNSNDGFGLDCSNNTITTLAITTYTKSHANVFVKSMLWFACGVGILEVIFVICVRCLLFRAKQNSDEDTRTRALAATGFKRFSFDELKMATRGFAEEIGRGAGGVVYKGNLSDFGIAAIKRLSETYQGEAEFLAEVNVIGRVNHMNLIRMWGYCSEGMHRLLVYEYLEHGSLKANLSTKVLDWKRRYEIALGTARGLAYLHEECLEWVLHCDVKPENILLGSDYQPKVADFGLSKLLNRGGLGKARFSKIRGTRGYMAPEWVTNQSITSKVDVFSYGIVVLEMLSGRSPCVNEEDNGIVDTQSRALLAWVREKVNESDGNNVESCVGKIMESWIEGEYDKEKMGVLLGVSLKCVEEDKDQRPTMSQVVEMLQGH